jgi:V-ATPase subunit C
VKEFLKIYETIAPMVVPRSASLVASDDEFGLYAVTTFKKHGQEFAHKARENKWIPRDFKYTEGGREAEAREVERVNGDERKLWGETLRLGRTSWSEAVMVWVHVLVLRVFVETVLRYGLPLDFVSAVVRVRSSSPFFWKTSSNDMMYRHPQKAPREQSESWTTSTITSRAMRSAATRRVASRRTTRTICKWPAREAERIIRHMCTMSLSLNDHITFAFVYAIEWIQDAPLILYTYLDLHIHADLVLIFIESYLTMHIRIFI